MNTAEETISAREARLETRLRELGTRNPRCATATCNETNPFALTGVSPALRCYECLAQQEGRSLTEGHHVAGQNNDPTKVQVPGNDHRILSETQAQEWPVETLRNPDASPLLRAAAQLRGWLDILRLLIERTLGWIPPFLEWLDARLCETQGARWWLALGWEGQA